MDGLAVQPDLLGVLRGVDTAMHELGGTWHDVLGRHLPFDLHGRDPCMLAKHIEPTPIESCAPADPIVSRPACATVVHLLQHLHPEHVQLVLELLLGAAINLDLDLRLVVVQLVLVHGLAAQPLTTAAGSVLMRLLHLHLVGERRHVRLLVQQRGVRL